jgi:hypothetical protein
MSCEAVPACYGGGTGMRRRVHPGDHAVESSVSFIPLFDGTANWPPNSDAGRSLRLRTVTFE